MNVCLGREKYALYSGKYGTFWAFCLPWLETGILSEGFQWFIGYFMTSYQMLWSFVEWDESVTMYGELEKTGIDTVVE